MNLRILPKWLAGALIAMLVLGAISVSNGAQAAPALHPLASAASSKAQGSTTLDKPASPAQGQPLAGLLPSVNQTGKHTAPAASGIVYQINTGSATAISGTQDINNHCDDCVTSLTFPFPVTFYGTQYNTANVSSNGNLQFNSGNPAYSNSCLADSNFTDAIFLYWDDLTTSDIANGRGIFTALVGNAPHRQFVVEWRASHHNFTDLADAEIIFNEDSATFTTIYGYNQDNGSGATAGVQEGDGSGSNSTTSYSCNAANLTPGLALDYVPQGGPTPTHTNTPPPTSTPNPCATGWSEQTSYPVSVAAQATTRQGSYIYSFGGTSDGTHPISASYKYDGTSWTPIASLPSARYGASAVSDGNSIYILNGSDSNSSVTRMLYSYNPASNTYNTLAASVISTVLQSAVYLNGSIYRIGGFDSANNVNSVEVYSTTANTWSTAADYPTAIAGEAAVALNGYIYTAGGILASNSSNLTNKTYRYNPATNIWEDGQIDDLPTYSRGLATYDVFNGQFMVAGGAITGTGFLTYTNTALEWNPNGNVWTSLPNMGYGEYINAGGTLGNAFYTIGGIGIDNHIHNDNQRYAPNGCATPTPGGPTNTPAATNTPGGPTPTDCPNPFVDTNGDIFYPAIHYLYCRGMVNGTSSTTFSPHGTSTRGQFAKVVVLGFGISPYTPVGNPDFSDVPANYFAYTFIESGFHAGILGGFDVNSCTAHGATYPCYLPNLPITRGQLTKLVVNAAHYLLFTPTGGTQTYSDVPPNNVFFASIETAHNKGVINGYPDNTFRPNQNIQRDQMCQIVYKGVTTP